MPKVKPKKNMALLLLLIGIIILEVALLLSREERNFLSKSHEKLKEYANQIVEKCKGAPYKPTCYDEEIPKLMDEISMQDTFKVTKLVQEEDSTYSYCHVLGHKLSAKEVQKDPTKWRDVLTRCPFGECANGCQHGLLQEVFRAEYLSFAQLDQVQKELNDVCEPRGSFNPSPFERAHCYHGLGHALLYSNPKEIPKLLEICDKISTKSDGSGLPPLCYEGLFMQIFQPLEPEDFALIKGIVPQKEDLEKFCMQFADAKKRYACWNQGWPLFRGEIRTPEGLIIHCENETFIENKNRCYNTLFHVTGQDVRFDIDKIDSFCSTIRKDLMGDCYSNAASSIMQSESGFIKRAVEMCKRGGKQGKDIENYCFDYMVKFSTYNYNPGSAQFTSLCNSLPESWRNKCYGGL